MIDTYGQRGDEDEIKRREEEMEKILKDVQKKLPNFAKDEKLESIEEK